MVIIKVDVAALWSITIYP